MGDKAALPGRTDNAHAPAEDTLRTTAQGASEGTKNRVGEGVSDPRQGIFDTRFAVVMDAFGEACERHGVNTAIAIALHPDDEHPMVFIRGHQFDAASLAAKVVRKLQTTLMQELSGEDYEDEA